MQISALILSLLISVSILAKDLGGFNPQSVIESYRKDYFDDSKSTLDLLEYYHSEVKAIHLKHIASGNRFTDLYIQWALNAPIELDRVDSFTIENCEELNELFKCVVLLGEDNSRDKAKITKVVLGFVKEKGMMKIGGVYIERGGNGSSYTFDIGGEIDQ